MVIFSHVLSFTPSAGWMDHGTLGLLWGMMLIVGITMRTGVFEWLGVMACKLSGGSKRRLCLLLCLVTGCLSAFLDNVTTILREFGPSCLNAIPSILILCFQRPFVTGRLSALFEDVAIIPSVCLCMAECVFFRCQSFSWRICA